MSTARPAKKRPTRDVAGDYRKKIHHEASRLAQSLSRSGHPAPLGDPASGITLVVEQPVGPRTVDALARSLEAINLPEAYVTWSSTGLLLEEILITQPSVLVAVGRGAAHDIDALSYPLPRRPFSEATVGASFTWTKSTSGFLLPALAPAFDDPEAKRLFWKTFLMLRSLVPTSL